MLRSCPICPVCGSRKFKVIERYSNEVILECLRCSLRIVCK